MVLSSDPGKQSADTANLSTRAFRSQIFALNFGSSTAPGQREQPVVGLELRVRTASIEKITHPNPQQ